MPAPTFASFVTILTGWVFARRRTVTGMLVACGAVRRAGRHGVKHHSAYHRVFAAARWSLDALGLAVFDLIAAWLPDGPVFLAVDDTLARKRGLKVFGVGMHHDPLLSTRKTALVNWGHSWVVLGVIVKFPFCQGKFFCLPILFRLYVNKKTATKKRLRYRTRPELAVEMLQVLCKAHENRHFHVVADSAYGGKSVYLRRPANCELTSRLTLDARLHDAPPLRRPGTNGRPRKRGEALPSPREMLHQRGRRLTLNIYGRRDRVRVIDRVAYLIPSYEPRVSWRLEVCVGCRADISGGPRVRGGGCRGPKARTGAGIGVGGEKTGTRALHAAWHAAFRAGWTVSRAGRVHRLMFSAMNLNFTVRVTAGLPRTRSRPPP
jgi:hypothetical protein